jgi:hypothetical protein
VSLGENLSQLLHRWRKAAWSIASGEHQPIHDGSRWKPQQGTTNQLDWKDPGRARRPSALRPSKDR